MKKKGLFLAIAKRLYKDPNKTFINYEYTAGNFTNVHMKHDGDEYEILQAYASEYIYEYYKEDVLTDSDEILLICKLGKYRANMILTYDGKVTRSIKQCPRCGYFIVTPRCSKCIELYHLSIYASNNIGLHNSSISSNNL